MSQTTEALTAGSRDYELNTQQYDHRWHLT